VAGVRARGGIVIMITHRPATLGPSTHLAVINSGRLVDFGPRDEVMQRMQAQNPQGQNPQGQTAQVQGDPAARPAGGNPGGKPGGTSTKESVA
jgi:ATP-binding cassette subfamily C protein